MYVYVEIVLTKIDDTMYDEQPSQIGSVQPKTFVQCIGLKEKGIFRTDKCITR